MRVGLVGTGHWADVNHAAALARSAEVNFAGVWGRNSAVASALAARYGVPCYAEYPDFLEAVEAVDFAVPPAAQAALATEAAKAGKHLLLEKPMATSLRDADMLANAIEENDVAALVFFTGRFRPELEAWLADASQGDWTTARGDWVTAALTQAGSPWVRSAWRWEMGGLWDLGPHALSFLLPVMGPVLEVSSMNGLGDVVHVQLRHAEGRTSALTFSLRAPAEAEREALVVWGEERAAELPTPRTTPKEALGNALATLARMVRSGARSHPCDASFGREVVRILERADNRFAPQLLAHVPR